MSKKRKKTWKRRYRIKKKKAFLKKSSFWLSLLFLIFAAALLWLVFISDVFQASQVVISGNQKVLKSEIETKIKEEIPKNLLFFSSKSIFLVSLDKIRQALFEAFPEIEDISLKKKLPNILEINIKEREASAIFCQDRQCFLLDRQGVIFESCHEQEQKEEQQPKEGREETQPQGLAAEEDLFKTAREKSGIRLIVRIGGASTFLLGDRVLEKKDLEALLGIYQELKDGLGLEIEEFFIDFPARADAKTDEGWWIYFSLDKDINLQIKELNLVLKEQVPSQKREELEYIDLRFKKILIYPDFSRYRSEFDY